MNTPTLRTAGVAIFIAIGSMLAGCTTTLVQPYNQKLYDDTEAFFKKASAMIDEGASKSPRTDDARKAYKAQTEQPGSKAKLADHPGHFSKFESRYDELDTDADALILQSLVASGEVGSLGQKIQGKINDVIEKNIPSACPDEDKDFQALRGSLTVMNYVDLRCLVTRWRAQHVDERLTQSTEILKRSNWEARKVTLFQTILTIQQGEAAKKKEGAK